MEIGLKNGVLGAIYLAWIGLGLSAYRSYPREAAYFYVALAVVFTGVLVWYVMDLDSSIRRESDGTNDRTEELQELANSFHICADPSECDRCSAFLWTFGPSVAVSASSHQLLRRAFVGLPLSSDVVILSSTSALLLSVAVHGVLNGLQKSDKLSVSIPDWVFSPLVKRFLGAIAGVSTMSIAVGVVLKLQ